MDLSDDSGTLPTHTTVGGPVLEQEDSLSNACFHTKSGGTILLQLLEFKTHLLEAVEELHIRRDAETRFEDQISKLVLERQELEWEKESLQQQIETVAKQHTESLSNVKKQFQAKIRNTEEEKGKYQVSAELKDKEINNLKEELKSLQLLKYNLEKKSTEMEQKLVLQNRSKDSHLNQLGEVEKRFSALSRQCAMIKQAHENLEHNVDEAMKINKKLTTANEKQEATIVSLKTELDEARNKLIKAKMSSVRHDKAHSPTGREQHFQKLHQKLNMENDINKILREENAALRAEKQEVMKSLQHAQQLLLSQTQTVSRVELELQTQREQCQALKQEHWVMQEKSKAMEDKVAQLMESYAASKNSWDKEKAMFLDCIKSEQQDRKAVKQAYDELHQEHTKLSSQARVQAQHIYEMEMQDSSQHTSVSKEVFHTLVEEIRGEETLNEPISSSELPKFGRVQLLASTQTKTPDCLEDTGAVTELVTGATGAVTTVSSPDHRAIVGSVDYLSEEKSDVGSGGMSEKEQGWNNDVKQVRHYREAGEIKEEQPGNRKEIQVEDVDDAGSAGEKRETLIAQTTDRADGRGDSQGSTENTGDPKTETKDRAEGKGTHGAEGRGKTGPRTAEFQIPAQTADTTTEKSDTQQVIDLMDTGPPLAAPEQSEGSESISQKVSEKDANSSHVNEGYDMRREAHTFSSVEQQSVNNGPNSVGQDVQHSCHDEVQTFAGSVSQLPSPIHHIENSMEEKPFLKSAASIPTELAAPLNLSSICSSQTSTTPLAAQSEGIVSVQEFETTTTQPSNVSDKMDEMCNTHVPQVLPQSQLISEQSGKLKSLVTGEDDKDSNTYMKGDAPPNVDTFTHDACKNAQEPPEKSNLKNKCADFTLDTEHLESQVKTGSCQENMKNVDLMTTKSKTDLKLSVHPSHESITSSVTDNAECFKQPPAEEMLFEHTDEFSLPGNKTYRPSFDWSSTQRKTVSSSDKSDVSILHHFVQGSPVFERRHAANTLPMFLKSKHNKVPLVITRASDLLNASSDSGTATSSVRHQQGEQKGLGETCRETATADTESRTSLSFTHFPVSTSNAVNKLPWQTTHGCGRAQTSPVGPSSESDWDASCSQEREDEQSSFRAQISKIEQFLNTERLRLPKRRKTDN